MRPDLESGQPTRAPRPSTFLDPYPKLSPPVSTAGAAVTIVLRAASDDVEVLLIERAVNDGDPASGQVALPGGRVEERDGSLAETALRELEEEVGIPSRDIRASLRYVRTEEARRFGLRVGVFAAELAERSEGPALRSPVEVAHVFWLPREALAQTEVVEQLDGSRSFVIRGVRHDGHLVWGFTQRVLRTFFGYPLEDGPVEPNALRGP